MLVAHSRRRRPQQVQEALENLLARVSAQRLREYVERLAFPRHYQAERAANLRARDLLLKQLHRFGYTSVRS